VPLQQEIGQPDHDHQGQPGVGELVHPLLAAELVKLAVEVKRDLEEQLHLVLQVFASLGLLSRQG
jgi:hypothetical protein